MGKQILFWAFSLVLLAMASAHALTMVSVEADNVNLRSGPGEKYPVVWTLGVGFPLSVLEERGGWWRVEDFEGDIGWISKDLVERKPHVIVKAAKANVRSGPSDRYKVVGKAKRGVVMQTLKVKNKWVKVRHESGLTGWVSRSLLWGW